MLKEQPPTSGRLLRVLAALGEDTSDKLAWVELIRLVWSSEPLFEALPLREEYRARVFLRNLLPHVTLADLDCEHRPDNPYGRALRVMVRSKFAQGCNVICGRPAAYNMAMMMMLTAAEAAPSSADLDYSTIGFQTMAHIMHEYVLVNARKLWELTHAFRFVPKRDESLHVAMTPERVDAMGTLAGALARTGQIDLVRGMVTHLGVHGAATNNVAYVDLELVPGYDTDITTIFHNPTGSKVRTHINIRREVISRSADKLAPKIASKTVPRGLPTAILSCDPTQQFIVVIRLHTHAWAYVISRDCE